MPQIPDGDPARLPAAYARFAHVYQDRCAAAMQNYLEASRTAAAAWLDAAKPLAPPEIWRDTALYATDFAQRSILFWDTLRQRGNNGSSTRRRASRRSWLSTWEMVADARGFARPATMRWCASRRRTASSIDPDERPFVIIDPRAGHGPGIGGFKQDSQVGVALKAGHPVYFVDLLPRADAGPDPRRRLARRGRVPADRARAPSRHAQAGGHRQLPGRLGGHAGRGARSRPASAPSSINGAPMSYWAGNDGENPMRYAGGMLGGDLAGAARQRPRRRHSSTAPTSSRTSSISIRPTRSSTSTIIFSRRSTRSPSASWNSSAGGAASS